MYCFPCSPWVVNNVFIIRKCDIFACQLQREAWSAMCSTETRQIKRDSKLSVFFYERRRNGKFVMIPPVFYLVLYLNCRALVFIFSLYDSLLLILLYSFRVCLGLYLTRKRNSLYMPILTWLTLLITLFCMTWNVETNDICVYKL